MLLKSLTEASGPTVIRTAVTVNVWVVAATDAATAATAATAVVDGKV